MFPEHRSKVNVVPLIKIPVISFFVLDLGLSLRPHRPALARFTGFRRTCADLRLLRKGRTHRKRHCVVELLQAPHALADDGAFKNAGHRDHVVGLYEVEADGDRSMEDRIGVCETQLFGRDIADQ